MTLGAAHLPAALTIPAAVMVAAMILWYGQGLSASDVPESRRRIRRACGALMLTGLPLLVMGLSFADPAVSGGLYVVTWLLFMFTLVLVVVLAGLDVVNTLRIERRLRRRRRERTAGLLGEIIRGARAERAEGER